MDHRVGWIEGGFLMAAGLVAVVGQPTRQEILQAVYPNAAIRDERLFLTEAQASEVARLSGVDAPPRLVARYVARRDDREVGRAYLDTHVVRTKKESLLVCLDAEGRILRIEVTAFLEPPEYQAPPAWYRQYAGRELDDDLQVNRAIRPLAGATLTAAAANQSARRILALDRILRTED